MKNKELSELLGIKPRYKIESGSRVFYFALKDKAKAEKQLNWLNYVNQNIDDYLLYPDFEKPENFVKLEEIILTIFSNFECQKREDGNYIYFIFPTGENVYTSLNSGWKEKRIESLTDLIKKIKRTANFFLTKFIQQAQQTEWVY